MAAIHARDPSTNRYRIQHPIVDDSTGVRQHRDPFNGRVVTLPDGYDERHTLITGCCNRVFKDHDLIDIVAPENAGTNVNQECECASPLDVRDVNLNIRKNLSTDGNSYNKFHLTPLRVRQGDTGNQSFFVDPYTGRDTGEFRNSISLERYVPGDDDPENISPTAYQQRQESSNLSEETKKSERLLMAGCCKLITTHDEIGMTHRNTCPGCRSDLVEEDFEYRPRTYFGNITTEFARNPFSRTTRAGLISTVGLSLLGAGVGADSPITVGLGTACLGLSKILFEVQNISPALRTSSERVKSVAYKALNGVAFLFAGAFLVSAFTVASVAMAALVALGITLTVYGSALGYVYTRPTPRLIPHPAHDGRMI